MQQAIALRCRQAGDFTTALGSNLHPGVADAARLQGKNLFESYSQLWIRVAGRVDSTAAMMRAHTGGESA